MQKPRTVPDFPYAVDADVTVASTIDPHFYRDERAHALAREKIFASTWQWIGDLADVALSQSLSPRTLLAGTLDEPLLLARDGESVLRCMSNVCTHRGNILVGAACHAQQIRCGYHSRRFDLAGRMTFMPEFGDAKDFPSSADDLPPAPFGEWRGHGFAALAPIAPLAEFIGDMAARTAGEPLEQMRHDPSRDREYVVDAHWALYVENYLEGFHIPFVHPDLDRVVDCSSYSSELFRYSNVQVARSREGLPAAQYWWIFPNLMLNFYPWGLSLNLVQPQGLERTRVTFRGFVADRSKLACGAGAGLDRVEEEDEAIVLAVQRGVKSRLYAGGRYSPARERGVHHFHRLVCEFLSRNL